MNQRRERRDRREEGRRGLTAKPESSTHHTKVASTHSEVYVMFSFNSASERHTTVKPLYKGHPK